MEKIRYMISDAAAAVDVETHVLRYWEDELGLDVPRNELGHRYYTRDNIKQFLRIKELKEKGYQLRAIRDMLHSDAPGEPLNPPNPGYGKIRAACKLHEYHKSGGKTGDVRV